MYLCFVCDSVTNSDCKKSGKNIFGVLLLLSFLASSDDHIMQLYLPFYVKKIRIGIVSLGPLNKTAQNNNGYIGQLVRFSLDASKVYKEYIKTISCELDI